MMMLSFLHIECNFSFSFSLLPYYKIMACSEFSMDAGKSHFSSLFEKLI